MNDCCRAALAPVLALLDEWLAIRGHRDPAARATLDCYIRDLAAAVESPDQKEAKR